jgi:hypothetical protein
MSKYDLSIGCRVIWEDPDGSQRHRGTVVHKSEPEDSGTDHADTIYGVANDEGGYVEAFGHELAAMTYDMKGRV